MPRRTQWRGKGHESVNRGGRTVGRKPRAVWRNSGDVGDLFSNAMNYEQGNIKC
jgi:hypothetical protein